MDMLHPVLVPYTPPRCSSDEEHEHEIPSSEEESEHKSPSAQREIQRQRETPAFVLFASQVIIRRGRTDKARHRSCVFSEHALSPNMYCLRIRIVTELTMLRKSMLCHKLYVT